MNVPWFQNWLSRLYNYNCLNMDCSEYNNISCFELLEIETKFGHNLEHCVQVFNTICGWKMCNSLKLLMQNYMLRKKSVYSVSKFEVLLSIFPNAQNMHFLFFCSKKSTFGVLGSSNLCSEFNLYIIKCYCVLYAVVLPR